MVVKREEIDFIVLPVRVNGTIKRALDLYSLFGVWKNRLIEDYLRVITIRNIEKANNPYRYLHKGIRRKDIEKGESELEKAFNEAAITLKKQKPTDVIRAAFYKTRNDSALECGYLLDEYIRMLSEDEDTLIVNPSPDMILQFEKRRLGKGINYYAVTDSTIAKLYSTQFKKAKFLAFNDPLLPRMFQAALIVNRDNPIEETDKLMRWLSCCKEQVLVEIPNAYLDNLDFGAEAQFKRCEFEIQKVLLLDNQLTVTSPRKKCLLYLGKESGKTEWDLYGTECDIKNKKFSIIDKGIRVNAIKYWKKHKTLIRIWNGINPEEEKEPQYGKAKEYIFSNEIHLSYTIYEDSRKVYTGRCWYKKLVNADPIKYGKRITPFVEKGLKATTEEEIEKNLWEKIFDERIYPSIYKDLREFFAKEKKPMSLKSLWIMVRNFMGTFSIYDEKVFIELLADSADGISAYQSEKHSVEELLSMLEDKLQMNRDDIPVKYYRQLHLLFEMARKQKYIKYNPLAEIMERMSKRASQRQRDIRNALTKKHFSSKEEQKIFQYLIAPVRNEFYGTNMPRCVEKSIGLVGAIRLFTGMTLREVCALRWCDFMMLEGTMEYQLLVDKFVDEQGKIMTHAQKEDWSRLRCMPVAHPLRDLLLQRKKYLCDKGIDGELLEELPIVLLNEDIRGIMRNKKDRFCKPIKAQEYCRELIKQADISEQVVILPDAKGEKSTDLHKYHGDIFASNLESKLNHICKMTSGEICYILGRVGEDTFSRYYCDYSNEMILYAMIQKMNRWTSKYEGMLNRTKVVETKKGKICANHQIVKSGPYLERCPSSHIVLKSESETVETVKLIIECEHGAQLETTKY